ncbi:hypothetical protein [Lichenihabitans psoromatis]|uniref:hypothetical protein n=1 Tax=Lichenihabitans psoromatis TaxID=2528642 RepID=UPI001A94D701|nr:hypothetical protein [Lichenihabitans psoromatis]
MTRQNKTIGAALACVALRQGRRVELQYGGYTRTVEVHAVGATAIGHPVVLVWQVSGGRVSGQAEGWKLLRLDELGPMVVTQETSLAPRPGFNPDHNAMPIVHCRCQAAETPQA